jgi:inorganic pyrophosphatase
MSDEAASLVDLPVGPESFAGGTIALAFAVVETPSGSSNKYEYDSELGVFKLDRVLANSVHFPGDYGFIPSTIAEDGEPLDVLILATGPSVPGMLVVARPVGVADVVDDGEHDAKIIAVAVGEPRHANVQDIADIGAHRVREIEHFFAIYKSLSAADDARTQSVVGWAPAASARERIAEAHARYAARRARG